MREKGFLPEKWGNLDPVFVLQNDSVIKSSDVIGTYVYRMGIVRFSKVEIQYPETGLWQGGKERHR